jgi:hypothetical protein
VTDCSHKLVAMAMGRCGGSTGNSTTITSQRRSCRGPLTLLVDSEYVDLDLEVDALRPARDAVKGAAAAAAAAAAATRKQTLPG